MEEEIISPHFFLPPYPPKERIINIARKTAKFVILDENYDAYFMLARHTIFRNTFHLLFTHFRNEGNGTWNAKCRLERYVAQSDTFRL